jgi:hypothetical protein
MELLSSTMRISPGQFKRDNKQKLGKKSLEMEVLGKK